MHTTKKACFYDAVSKTVMKDRLRNRAWWHFCNSGDKY